MHTHEDNYLLCYCLYYLNTLRKPISGYKIPESMSLNIFFTFWTPTVKEPKFLSTIRNHFDFLIKNGTKDNYSGYN